MFNIVLYQPEIPPNTGNIIRLCSNTGCRLHLVKPLGFSMDDRQLKRAGLDYAEKDNIFIYDNFDIFLKKMSSLRLIAFSTHHDKIYSTFNFNHGDALIFGPETRGLPKNIRSSVPSEQQLKVPMRKKSRSLNLSNTVAIVVYEAWRQCNYVTE